MTPAVLVLIVLSVALNALAQIALRTLMLAVGSPPVGGGWAALGGYAARLGLNPWFLAGLGCYVVSLALWLLVLARVEVGQAYPLLSIGYVLTAAIGYFYLGESLGAGRLLGLGLICVGIAVMARS